MEGASNALTITKSGASGSQFLAITPRPPPLYHLHEEVLIHTSYIPRRQGLPTHSLIYSRSLLTSLPHSLHHRLRIQVLSAAPASLMQDAAAAITPSARDMASKENPFSSPPSAPGHGTIHLSLLPPNTPRLRTVHYQYPLKLVSPAPVRIAHGAAELIHTVYLLTYGGGLVAGDVIDLDVILESHTRLTLLTQGSTKLFKSISSDVVSRQTMTVTLAPGAALCYLPDPVQPFEKSCFEQKQVYNITVPDDPGLSRGNLCVLDWVSNGRPANGENWSFFRYGSRNEVYLCQPAGDRRLLLRDNLMLDQRALQTSVAHRMDGLAVYGTLVVYGSMFTALGKHFAREFKALPRIGGQKWDSGSDDEESMTDPVIVNRLKRQRMETASKVLWSVASVRGCTVVKFGAPTVEAGRRWLWTMLSDEGSIVHHFGERALLCLR